MLKHGSCTLEELRSLVRTAVEVYGIDGVKALLWREFGVRNLCELGESLYTECYNVFNTFENYEDFKGLYND